MYSKEHASILIKHHGHLLGYIYQCAYHASVYSFTVSVILMYKYLNSVSMHIQIICMNLLKKNRNNSSGNDFLSPPNSFPGRKLSSIRVTKKTSKRQLICHLETADPSIFILHLHVIRGIFILV